MNRDEFIRIHDLPEDIQEELRRRQKSNNRNTDSNINIGVYIEKYNQFTINAIDNSTRNRNDETTLDILMKGIGRAAGKTYAWLKDDTKRIR